MSHALRLLILLPSLLLILPAAALEEAKQTRTVRLLFLNAPQNAPTTVHLHDGQTSQEVQLPRMNLSQIYEVPAGPLTLRLLAAPVEDPELVPPDSPTVQIPETIGDAYLLCTSDPTNPVVPLRIDVVDACKDKFRNGQMMWINQTSHEISGKLEDKKITIEPLGTAIIDTPISETGSYSAAISYKIKDDKRAHPICETRWMSDSKSRQLVFVFTEADKRLPRIMGFPDFRPSPPPKKPP